MTAIEITAAIELLRAEVQRTSLRKVAPRLGLSITTISLVLAGKYPAKMERVASKTLAMLAKHVCKHTGADIAPIDCAAISSSKAPTHNPSKMAHWRTCRACAHAKKQEEQSCCK